MEEIPESGHARVPLFLWLTYAVVLVGGIWAFFAYWNGSSGWLDRGYWRRLQEAAHTTVPFQKRIPYLAEERIEQLEKKGEME